MATYLAFDFGEKRIGSAVGDSITGTARPLATLDGLEAAVRLVQDWRPRALVVGLPLNEDGSEQAITTKTRAFVKQLEARCKLPVHLADERYSSRAADDVLRSARASGAMNRRVRKGDRDGLAAKIILEQWLATAQE
ncbi:MAG: Holliday junction resolvase RuvX [Nevskiaceae bacterium]|nr:MAG: Holliday junction resolvase RuvX [Nevskiaceae bacterium]TAM27456.1 MAG: Holliday junction resolvase RuvX [Nevskiaceae bacterium]